MLKQLYETGPCFGLKRQCFFDFVVSVHAFAAAFIIEGKVIASFFSATMFVWSKSHCVKFIIYCLPKHNCIWPVQCMLICPTSMGVHRGKMTSVVVPRV